jgi:hypothetical protein
MAGTSADLSNSISIIYYIDVSVAKGPKFRPQNSKGAIQKFVRPEKLAAEFSINMPKKGRKGAELF